MTTTAKMMPNHSAPSHSSRSGCSVGERQNHNYGGTYEMKIRRGEVYYIEGFQTVGSEQHPGRPAIIVSNDMNNEFSSTVEVIYLTTQPKTNLPTHVEIHSLKRDSIALCEQISSVAVENVSVIGTEKSRLTRWRQLMTQCSFRLGLKSKQNRRRLPTHRNLIQTFLCGARPPKRSVLCSKSYTILCSVDL